MYQADGTGLKTYYLYSQEGVLAEATQPIVHTNGNSITEEGQPILTTIYGNTPDNPNSTYVLFIRTKNNHGADTTAYYVHDQLGTPLQAVDKFGNVVWAMHYDAFGNTTDITPRAADKYTIISNLRLPGQYADSETGLYYNWNRYYDPLTGRYITKDPIGLAGGMNTYGYVGGSPLTLTDPQGLYAGIDGAAFIVGGAIIGTGARAITDLITGRSSSLNDYSRCSYSWRSNRWGIIIYCQSLYSWSSWWFCWQFNYTGIELSARQAMQL